MQIYLTGERWEEPRAALARVGGDPTQILIELGEIEAGLADAGASEAVQAEMRRACVAAGKGEPVMPRLEGPLPARIRMSVPEGYAYYALFPESYAAAARRFWEDVRPGRVVAIGIRSIGTSLSAVVAGTLERYCRVESCTVRPVGHPFDRQLELTADREAWLRERRGWHFAVVDEGPGLSGSSFACVARKLGELGVPDDRIALFPGWGADGSGFRSAAAREQWKRHRRFVGPEIGPPEPEAIDWSAGRWREQIYGSEADWPAVHPQHECRKYLSRDGRVLWRFAGLGRYGEAKRERAERLAEAGFGARVLGFERGFLGLEFVPGRPERPEPERVARYLAFLRCEFPAEPDAGLAEMARQNVREALGIEWDAPQPDGPATALDGRMLPQEWVAGIHKVDALDHHAGHFFPGCQDIAWDVAGAEIELGLDVARRYRELSGDRDIERRLPWYRIAYLAFRTGYTDMAGETAEAERFGPLKEKYLAELKLRAG